VRQPREDAAVSGPQERLIAERVDPRPRIAGEREMQVNARWATGRGLRALISLKTSTKRIPRRLSECRREWGMGFAKKMSTLCAVAALTAAVTAPAASADSFTFWSTANGQHTSATVTAAQSASHVISAGEGFGGITCTTVNFSGSAFGTEAWLTMSPSYSGCKDSFGRTVDVSVNGCSYVFKLGVTFGAGDVYSGETDIECPKEKSIAFTVTNGSGTVICTMTVGAQTGLTFTSYRLNTASPADITIEFNVSGMFNTTSGGFFNCGVSNGSHFQGTYQGKSTLTAVNFIGGDPLDSSIEPSFG
jgi:hypothetical protein